MTLDDLPGPGQIGRPGGQRHVVIVGPMGVGKSTVGSALAARMGRPFSDSDREIERLLGLTGRDVAARYGVEALHQVEASMAMIALFRTEPLVIAVAASVVENHTVQWLLSVEAYVVRLLAAPEVLAERGSRGRHRRPMAPRDILELADRREPFFRLVQDVSFDVEVGVDHIVAAVDRLCR